LSTDFHPGDRSASVNTAHLDENPFPQKMITPSDKRVKLLNISLDNLSMDELLRRLGDGGVVVTPNVDHMMKLQRDPEFHQVYRHSDYVVCDSQILYCASKILGQPIREKISGSDLFPAYYNYYKHDRNVRIFLLGGPPGVAEEAQKRINTKVGRAIICETYCPPFGFEHDELENERIIRTINQSDATVIAVGLGAPKQEKWIYQYKDRLVNIKTFLAIGATINFEAGHTPRSPEWMSRSGLEWVYRLASEPERLWKRYLIDDLPFGWLLIQQMLNRYDYQLPLGQILQDAELLSPEQVAQILALQKQSQKRRFGDLVIEQGWLAPATVHFFADQLPKLPRSRYRLPIGEYLKTAAILNEEQIYTILSQQDRLGGLFGEIAVQQGWVAQGTINLLLNQLSESQRPVPKNPNLAKAEKLLAYLKR
jgi:N-acetylglucosaminyldiphosphoundecaprenol N-acetyl-beta-D-mannosaminyltransferase